MTEANRVALVTGANKGIGLEIVKQLAEAGVNVVMSARDAAAGGSSLARLKKLGLEASLVQLDVLDERSVAAATDQLERVFGRLDILVNNAGIVDVADGPPTQADPQAIRKIFETNFFGVITVTQAMMPLLMKSKGARIINLSSALGSISVNGDPTSPFYSSRLLGYNASKAALNMFTVQLSEELRDTPHAVNSISPGFVKTDLTGQGFLTPEQGARTPVAFALEEDGAVSGKFVGPRGSLAW